VQLVLKHSVQNPPFQMLVFKRDHIDQVQRTLDTYIYMALTTKHLTPLLGLLSLLTPPPHTDPGIRHDQLLPAVPAVSVHLLLGAPSCYRPSVCRGPIICIVCDPAPALLHSYTNLFCRISCRINYIYKSSFHIKTIHYARPLSVSLFLSASDTRPTTTSGTEALCQSSWYLWSRFRSHQPCCRQHICQKQCHLHHLHSHQWY
jgi:hypothetical protein